MKGQHDRTIDVMKTMTEASEKDIMFILYLLGDLEYSDQDIRDMADLLHERVMKRG